MSGTIYILLLVASYLKSRNKVLPVTLGNIQNVMPISDDFNVVFDLFGWIVDDELLPEHLLKAVKDYLVGQYPKIIPLSRYLNRPLIA